MSQFDNYVICKHPFDQFIGPDTRTLIIGTFPTHERNYKSTFNFYYAGEGNVFWPILERVFRKRFEFTKGAEAKKEREQFLESNGIGITDMLEKCYRKNGKSQDEYIFPITFRKIFDSINEYKSIERILLTSRTKIVGALGLFETLCHHHDLKPPNLTRNMHDILEGWFHFGGRDIEVLVPYSTSKSVIENGTATFEQLESMYRLCLT